MVNFYRRFLPNAAIHQAPLHAAIANLRGNQPITWTPELRQAFETCKESLAHATLLVHPDATAPLALFTDASNTSVAACLQQLVNGSWQPLAFFSHKLNSRQAEWPAYYRELHAIYSGIQHFRHMLEAQNFTVYTDHKPITYAFQQRRERLPPVQLNQLSFISQFTTDIRHVDGAANVVADALSRVDALKVPQAVDLQDLARAQNDDAELRTLLEGDTALNLKRITVPGTDTVLYTDTTTLKPRPYVPAPLRRQVFDALHNLSHPGARATTRLVSERFVWPNIRKDCRLWARACLQCQRSKISRHVHSPLGNFQLPSARFSHVHVDIIGPLPPVGPYRYCLTAVDRYTRWPEVWPLERITAEDTANALLQCWISRFGSMSCITTDQGRQFESELFKALGTVLGTTRSRTCSWHPCANGMVERFHRQLKAAIMCHPGMSWLQALPIVLLGIRSTIKEDLKSSPAELLYGEPLRLPGELLIPSSSDRIHDATDYVTQLRQLMSRLRPTPASRHTQPGTFVFKEIASCSHAFLRDDTVRGAIQPPYSGPHPIICRDDKTMTLLVRGRNIRVSIDRVKPAFILSDDVQVTSAHPAPTSPTSPGYTTRSGRRVRFRLPAP